MNEPEEVIESPIMQATPDDDDGIVPPWGATASSALRWAFNHTLRSNIAPTALAQMRTRGGGRSIDMSVQELSAQAALIRQEVNCLEAAHVSIIIAYYLPRPAKERLPGGGVDYTDKYYGERKPAIRALGHWLMQQQTGGGQKFQAGYEEAVTQYCIDIHNNDRLCNRLKVRRERAEETRDALFERLADLRHRALYEMAARLVNMGLIPA